jgi:FlgD Ig-like domain
MARGESYQGTLSGTLIKQTTAVTTWFLYPGACVQRALNNWSGKLLPVADSLQPTTGYPNSSGYVDNQPDIAGGNNLIAYTRTDLSIPERLWRVVNSSVPAAQRPAIIQGSNSIWCGKFDGGWPAQSRVGYPNLTFQILYINTGTHGGTYNLTFQGEISAELNYDAVTVLGGGTGGPAGDNDPLENRRDLMSDIVFSVAAVGQGGPNGNSQELACFSGSIGTAQSVTANTSAGFTISLGGALNFPTAVTYAINGIPAIHKGIYFVFQSDCLYSDEDGNWPISHGQVLDNIAVSDNGQIYLDQAEAGGSDHTPGSSIVKGTEGSFGFVSCRVPPGIGELWQLAPGTENVTADNCSPQKALGTDLFFEGGDPTTNLSIDKQFNSINFCVFSIPAGTGSVIAQWNEYLDLPTFAGLTQDAEYRIYKNGSWGNWQDTDGSNQVTTGALQAWTPDGNELAAATQADSVQVRLDIRCIGPFAADRLHCSSTQSNALLYDDLRLQVTTGVPAPLFGIFPGAVAQTTFVDGHMGTAAIGFNTTNCTAAQLTAGQCWPGNRGSGLGQPLDHNIATNDNWNAATGDSITLSLLTGLRKNGMGVNWRHAFTRTAPFSGELGPPGSEYNYLNTTGFNAAFDVPRMIFRLYDPVSNNWSPWDSTELIANNVSVGSDTTLVEQEFQMNWPPFDKSIANASLPGGFSVGGQTSYNALRFLPRGSRMQYYFKAVDINGGTSYQFTTDALAREVDDLPTLPGSSIVAPDIIEFDVLPRRYAAGPGTSLLAGRTNTPLLNLDGVYATWAFGYDPVTQALRGLGVRADRYRFLPSGTTANHFGGHELPGKRPDRLSNFFPNVNEYPITDSLAAWYRIMIESNHTRTQTVFNEQDATLAEQWWKVNTDPTLGGHDQTIANGGDRCFFFSGDDGFNNMLNTTGVDITLQTSLSNNVFGVAAATNAWTGTTGNAFPTIDDRFAAATAGPALAPAGTFTYPIDGGCPGPNKFDALTKVANAEAAAHATYPNAQIAGIAMNHEQDVPADFDRNKAVAYAFSIQFIRDPTYPTTNANYTHSGVENRMRVLYKFLTGCRGAHSAGSTCWPCPNPTPETIASMQGEWATQAAGFQTSTYGPLYPIQAAGLATAVEIGDGGAAAPRINKIEGNFPNPFNPQTAMRFTSAQAGKAEVRIFSVGGQLVRKLNANVTVGANEVRWNGRGENGTQLASGVYFYKIVFPNGESLKAPNNLVLVK